MLCITSNHVLTKTQRQSTIISTFIELCKVLQCLKITHGFRGYMHHSIWLPSTQKKRPVLGFIFGRGPVTPDLSTVVMYSIN